MKCECDGCLREGNRDVAGRLVCDECYLRNGHLIFPWPEKQSFLEQHPRLRNALYVLLFAYIIGGAICGTIGLYRAAFPMSSLSTPR